MTLLLIPLVIWLHATFDHWTFAAMFYVLMFIMVVLTVVMALTFKACVQVTQALALDHPPAHQLWRLAAGMLAVAASIDVGWPAMLVCAANFGLMEVMFEVADRPVGESHE